LLDRVTIHRFQPLLSFFKSSTWTISGAAAMSGSGISEKKRTKRSTVEIQQAVRFNLFHIREASARAEDTGVPAKGLTGQA